MLMRRRHTSAQIMMKLAMADEMAANGRLHGDIAKSLGVSLMTYHRWRKARTAVACPTSPSTMNTDLPVAPNDWEQARQIQDLQQENSRLRRLVADLLLEKVKLEEGIRGTTFSRQAGRN
jgi:putative transposase